MQWTGTGDVAEFLLGFGTACDMQVDFFRHGNSSVMPPMGGCNLPPVWPSWI